MKEKISHLETRSGTPLCMMGTLIDREHITCSYPSKRAAQGVAKRLNAKGHNIKVVEGPCPTTEPAHKQPPKTTTVCPTCGRKATVIFKLYKKGQDTPSRIDSYCPRCNKINQENF